MKKMQMKYTKWWYLEDYKKIKKIVDRKKIYKIEDRIYKIENNIYKIEDRIYKIENNIYLKYMESPSYSYDRK